MPHYYTMQTPNAALPHRRSAAHVFSFFFLPQSKLFSLSLVIPKTFCAFANILLKNELTIMF